MPAQVRRRAAALVVGALLLPPAIVAAQSPPASVDTSRALSVRYVDGRSVVRTLKASGGMWTPDFPRTAGATPTKDGAALTTLHVKHVVEAPDVVVTVALSYGGPSGTLVTVATVRVPPDASVEVTGLRAYGVEPITLAIVPIPETKAYVPEAVSVSPQIEVRVEPVNGTAAAYRLTVTNRSEIPLKWVQIKGLRGGKEISSRPKGKRDEPLLQPGGQHIMDWAIGGLMTAAEDGPERWQPVDRIAITSALWQDGIVEGDPEPAASQARYDADRASRLDALIAALGSAAAPAGRDINSAIRAFRGQDLETQEAGDALLTDLEAFGRTGRSARGLEFEAWRARTIIELTAWRRRIVMPKL